MTPVALLALACLAREPAPIVSYEVHRALRGDATTGMAAAPKAEVASAVRTVAAVRRGRR